MKGKAVKSRFYGRIQDQNGLWVGVEVPADMTIKDLRIMGVDDVEKVDYFDETLGEVFEKKVNSLKEFFEDMQQIHEINKTTEEV